MGCGRRATCRVKSRLNLVSTRRLANKLTRERSPASPRWSPPPRCRTSYQWPGNSTRALEEQAGERLYRRRPLATSTRTAASATALSPLLFK